MQPLAGHLKTCLEGIPSSPVLGDNTAKQHVHIPSIRAEIMMALGLLWLSVREVWPKLHWLRMESRASLMAQR